MVLDSYVFSKLFLQEADRQEAVELITELSQRNVKVLVPSLFLYEVLSISAASPFPMESAYALITQYQSANLEIVALDEKTILTAFDICAHGYQKSGFPSFYDASYHALAISNECQFITADKRHVAKTKNFGSVTLLQDWRELF